MYYLACEDYCQGLCDSWNNTYSCVRVKKGNSDTKFCQIVETDDFIEHYDVLKDPFELTNLYPALSSDVKLEYHKLLDWMKTCSGHTCHL